jgi:mono/diheme cytochrome c family protein
LRINGTAPTALLIATLTVAASLQASAQDFAPEQIRKGADIYAQNCSPCHGARMLDPNAAFDLRKFPPGEKNRFVNSVTRGKNQMPPWGDLLQSDDIDALWAYIRAGER